jgi:lysophospholipase L1-like esterase
MQRTGVCCRPILKHPARVRLKSNLFLVAIFLLLCWSLETAHAQTRWVGSWATSQQVPEPKNALPPDDLRDATLRQLVHLSIGGTELRVHISNRFGTAPLHFTSVHIARPVSTASAQILPATDKALTFSSKPDVIVPAGADYISDPVAFSAAPLSDLAITLHLDQPPAQQTGHPGSRTTSYVAHGDQVSAPDLPNAQKVEHWYFISGVDVAAPSAARAIVVLGDSITDGHGATTNANNRWPDLLAKRLQADPATQPVAVLNHGIGGNRLLLDGLGPNALARFDHDVVAQPGVRYLIVLEGINDIGTLTRDQDAPPADHQSLVQRMIAAYEQIIARAHAQDIKVFGATLLPFGGGDYYHPGPPSEADRQAVNQWIRTPGHFDAVIDLDQPTRDPQHPDRILPKFDSGDHLHPSPEGFAAMAGAVPLSLFTDHASSTTTQEVALTFDDLPAHASLPPGMTREDIARSIIQALQNAQAPPVYGFVNAKRPEAAPEDKQVLELWRRVGFPLGNHAFSHMDLHTNSLAAFEQDVLADEPILREFMGDQDWHWFRFPYLREGETREKHRGVMAFLKEHGYRVAEVSLSFGDYAYNDPYARCVAKNDTEAVEWLRQSYLSQAAEELSVRQTMAKQIYGHDIKHVMLLHIGSFETVMLPKLLDLLKQRGFKLVTLQEAESDPAYAIDPDLPSETSGTLLDQMAAARHIARPQRSPSPSAKLEGLCR